ncbi:signal peptide peptidase SppA [Thalassomonas sp. RHCl1]|uniref:signal peptide peptidase SppA n=1 Tax=Thalassomonas sp. RHCl1 TaxID=2995320 RepID=UPI00248B9A21|nr:signal peptide peptidase SppA [Thalassomonas sp. RHCl1]
MNQSPGTIKRLSLSLWRLLNISRKVIVNLVFFTLLLLFFVAISQDGDKVVIPKQTALVLNLKGDIVEQKREIDPMSAFMAEAMNQPEENPEVLLSDILEVISQAKNDDRVSVLVLQLQNMNRAGLTKLSDIAKAIEDFKTSGKQVIAVGDQYTQDQYYLASHANNIWLDPKGWMILDGYGRYQMYFKSALDKLAISQHIFRVGTYKSAVEPYMRDDMSPAAKEANRVWLNDLWGRYKEDVAKQRKFGVENFDESIDDLVTKFKAANGNFAEYALNNHWVDALKTREQMRDELIKLAGENSTGDSYSHVTFKEYLSTIKSPFPVVNPGSDKIAVVVAKGTILNGTQSPGTIGGDSTAKLLRKARQNDKVKAVVLRVDSPGGSAYASEIIRREIELLKAAGKPVVASMGTYAASGGYWISASANKIMAAPTTITGSIGIFGLMMTFEKSLDKLGIHTDGVGTTDIAGYGLTRPLTDGMAQIFQLNIDRGYQDFISLVADSRNMTVEQIDEIAQGRVWSGARAKELGLVDELGDLDDAVNAAAGIAGLDNYDTLLIEKELTPQEIFMQNLLGNALALIGTEPVANSGPVEQFISTVRGELTRLNQFNDPQGIYSFCLTCEAY